MLRLVLTRILSFSAITAFAFALLMLDPASPSLVSEAKACDQEVYYVCYENCGFACIEGSIQECNPWNGCQCEAYCDAVCRSYSGC
jgi:hypothetical protein